ncbi:MAG TPA: hypothetical protein VGJ19_19205 [Streptosporangiaceae bacterium]
MSSITGRRHRRQADGTAGVASNERLTALTGVVLLIGFAIEGVTILRIGRLLTLHFFLGLLLIGPVLLKTGSTVYRIVRYYTGAAPYVRRGPPPPMLRLLGPFVIATSLAVLGTGVALAVVGPDNGPWLFLHKVSFIVWIGVMTLHVLAHIWRLPRILLSPDRSPAISLTGGAARWLLVAAALACGLVIALLAVHLAGPWEAARFGR